MVENIPLVVYMDTSQWPKDMHLGYAKNVIRRIDEEWTEEYPAPAKLLQEITPLKTAVTKEDEDYEQSRKSDQTALIRQADDERDALLNQALTVIDAMAKVSALPESQHAALILKGLVDIYKPSAKLALRDESTQVDQWLQALIQLSEDRKDTDRCMRNFFRMMDAVACVDANEQRYLVILGRLQQDQTEWRQRYDEYRRSAKRVSVKSSIVGNHLYSVSRGWTWAQLIDDGKALLAIDTEDDTRIISTDKKAEKAGGLYIWLSPVRLSSQPMTLTLTRSISSSC